MTNSLFGSVEHWGDIPLAIDAHFVPTPVGKKCLHCEEAIEEGDFGSLMPFISEKGSLIVPAHHECSLLGIVGHLMGVCRCTNYADQPTMRLAALECWERMENYRE